MPTNYPLYMPNRIASEVYTAADLSFEQERYRKEIRHLQEQMDEMTKLAVKHISLIEQWEKNGEYRVLGSLYKNNRHYEIVAVIRYPDNSQRSMRFTQENPDDLYADLAYLKETYPGDWSGFKEEIRAKDM